MEGRHLYSERAFRAAKRLRAAPTASEERLWQALRKLKLNIRRQAPVGRFVVDFVCHTPKLVIEVDGGAHRLPEVQARDAEREAWLKGEGFHVVRVGAEDAYGAPEDVAYKIAELITSLPPRGGKGRVGGEPTGFEEETGSAPNAASAAPSVHSPPSPTLPPSRGKGAEILSVLSEVPDPEVPAVTIVDLGMVREVTDSSVAITPTYTGCPATLAIHAAVRIALDAAGFEEIAIRTVIDPPWTTDWITPEGHEKLRAYGIAPPTRAAAAPCPQCGSTHTQEVSHFGSTPCKALWRCLDCAEPFDRFKCH